MPQGAERLDYLDGLRGLAALWVFLGHALLLTGFDIPILRHATYGVDLFILLSGFLMVFQFQLRSKFEDWSRPTTIISFWLRRFFRIAPLFYVLFAVALFMGPWLFELRAGIDSELGLHPQLPRRYLDASAANIAAHVSFLFGLIPQYSFRTPLPDWSIGLEMQFYAVFPFFLLVAERFGWRPVALTVGVAAAACVFGLDQLGVRFPMPAFLPLKLHLFLAGMLLAVARTRPRRWSFVVLAALFAAIPYGGPTDPGSLVTRVVIVLFFSALIFARDTGPAAAVRRYLSGRAAHWLGELSYSAYLIHLLVMTPVASAVLAAAGGSLAAPARFAVTVAEALPLTYGLSALTYAAFERPGQRLGRHTINALFGAKRGRPTDAERQAAP
ncbi:hypothetical protein B5C34_13780 [Pacificimonas flava]|uniref:Acyltransferase 3 domain-containing protein n=2 Tax=Pacificimonas TaxID=1960290 RepID=A0A219B8E3_9SPHN|nr:MULTISPECIES: acyltransferase [Pacificimonas]MBZ6379895.1 acyltransferase [Pacificimonas aurantium]OWV34423.1 hypothetical protein B5C34_13780 [Pacificimonas flava]